MAAFEKIERNIIYPLRHNTRETPKPPKNIEIDPSRSHLNYQLSPPEHGTTAKECREYFNKRMEEVKHINSDRLVKSCEWVVSAPRDLEPSQKEAFFRETYNHLLSVCGGEKACVLAVVHVDEKVKNLTGDFIAGADHLHFVFIPEVKNQKFITMKDKCIDGLHKTQKHFGTDFLNNEQAKAIFERLKEFEKDTGKYRDRDAIRDIGEILSMKRDDARWVFNRVRRTESERYETKVCADELVTKKYLKEFHPGLQKHLDDCGIKCTVHRNDKSGKEIYLTVSQLKEISKATGVVLDKAITVDDFARLINENRDLKAQVKELQKSREIEPGWGKSPGWGKEINQGEKTWSR